MTDGARVAVDALVDWIKAEEGFRGFPYPDSKGITTIGYGRNLEANPLTPEEAEYLLGIDLLKAARIVASLGPWTASLDEVRWSVLVAMAFQMGYRIKQFRNTLADVKARRYASAARRMLESKWAKVDSPERAVRAARLMETGRWDALSDS